jgi:hypothetical protein
MKKWILLIFFIVKINLLHAQTWVTVSSSQSFISYSFPVQAQKIIDTLDIQAYLYETSDSITLFCNINYDDSSFASYLNSDSEDSIFFSENDTLANPLYIFGNILSFQYDSIFLSQYSDIFNSSNDLIGRDYQYTVNDPDLDNVLVKIDYRLYYNGHDFAIFFIKAPNYNDQRFALLKQQFFSSIQLSSP